MHMCVCVLFFHYLGVCIFWNTFPKSLVRVVDVRSGEWWIFPPTIQCPIGTSRPTPANTGPHQLLVITILPNMRECSRICFVGLLKNLPVLLSCPVQHGGVFSRPRVGCQALPVFGAPDGQALSGWDG